MVSYANVDSTGTDDRSGVEHARWPALSGVVNDTCFALRDASTLNEERR